MIAPDLVGRLRRLLKRLRRTRLVDSGYGTMPSGAGPAEHTFVRLIPVDKTREGVEYRGQKARRLK